MALRINVLGPLTAETDGAQAPLGGPRQRAVLAVLVAARGEMVTAERIVAEVWGDDDDPPSMSTLHSYIARLRRALEPARAARGESRVLVREGTGYLLRADVDVIDAERFTRLAADGERLLAGGDAEGAVGVFAEGLGLWRGRPYADFADAGFAAPEAARLEGLRRTVRESLFTAQLALGRHASVIGDLEKYTAEEPLSERGWELLARALYRCGRQGDALAALRTARRTLADELGIDPGPALRELEASILAQDEPNVPAPAPAPVDRSGNLPFALSGLVGRDGEVRQVGELLGGHRLVTLTGPGGIGKTRLALETARARRDEDGPWLVELAGVQDAALLAGALAEVLGISGPPSVQRVADALRERRLLLVLDNCEHLLEDVAGLVAELLARVGGLRVLATSRSALGVDGEAVYDVPPLPGHQARELFMARAGAVVPGWRPGAAELTAADRLCAELDGLPLAIELAAAQLRVLSVEQIVSALDDRFAVLTRGTGPQRHRTLLRTVEWSHRLLEPDERELFHRLSVFASSFDLDAANAVAGRSALAGLGALVGKSLLSVDPGSSPRRYRLLETLKEFARTRQGPEELAEAQAAHRAWVLGRAEAAAARLRGPQAVPAINLLVGDLAEHRAAFTSALLAGDGEYALRLGTALHWFWYRRGHVAEGLSWLTTAMEMSPHAAPDPRAGALIGMAGLSYLAGDFPGALEAARGAAEAAREAGDLVAEGQSLTYRALFGGICGSPTAVADARAALDLTRIAGEAWLEAEALMALGMLLLLAGRVGEARPILTDSITVAADSGHGFVLSSSTWLLMKTDLNLGEAERALPAGVDILLRLDDEGDITSWLVGAHTLAAALALTGNPHDGARLLGAVQAIGARVGFSPLEMDPVDTPRQAEQVRRALPPEEYERRLEEGRGMDRAQVRALVETLHPARVR